MPSTDKCFDDDDGAGGDFVDYVPHNSGSFFFGWSHTSPRKTLL